MGIVVYNEWQKEGSPLGSSFAAADASLHRRLRRRHTPRVKASARSSFSSSAQFAHSRYGAEELFVATERNAKLRYEGYKKLSEM